MGTQCTKGFRLHEFDHLSKRDKKKLLRLIAQVSETAYRRGAQQGAVFALDGVIDNAHAMADWRYDIPIDRRPFLDRMTSTSWKENEEMGCCSNLFGVRMESEYTMKRVYKVRYRYLAKKEELG